MEHLRKPLGAMAIKLFLAAKELHPDDNMIMSPFTVTSIVTMLYYAAEGDPSGRQIEHILRYADLMDGRADPTAVLMAFREATRILTKSSKSEELQESTVAHEFHMVIGNRVFIQRDSHINPEFLETVQKNLKIEFEHLNFDEDAEASLTEIERWLKGKITAKFDGAMQLPDDLVDQSYTGPRMVIASAAHFRAGWEVPFDRSLTRPAPFYLDNGKCLDVETMHLTDRFPYYEDTVLE